MPQNITIKISDACRLWARWKAAEENTSVSKLVEAMLEREMRLGDAYSAAFEHWKANRLMAEESPRSRMNRARVHERR